MILLYWVTTEPYHVRTFLRMLYGGVPAMNEPISCILPAKAARNSETYQRNLEGARAVDLAKEFGVSLQRTYIRIQRNRRG